MRGHTPKHELPSEPHGTTTTLLRVPQPGLEVPPAANERVHATRAEELAGAPTTGSTLAGRYTVLNVLGQGGMGLVLAAYDSRLDRRVALKLLRAQHGAGREGEAEARLVREAQAMARLSHPNVVGVYDAGTLEGGPIFIAMEYVEGQTLRGWSQQKARTWREVLDAYVAAGRGLAAAHGAGIIHRDFKPDNVLVGLDGRVRVTDFGLARARPLPARPLEKEAGSFPASESPPAEALLRALTEPGALMGTPAYMAPEMFDGQAADVRNDVYAFSVALYEALYGQLPYAGAHIKELRQSQREGRVRPPLGSSQVPQWVFHILSRGLEADATQRPHRLEALLDALEADPEERRRGRRRAVAGTAAVALLVAVAAAGWIRQRGPGCGQQQHWLAGIWDEAVREQLRRALGATGLPYASDTSARVSEVLDGYAVEWMRQRTEVCEALREQQAQPGPLAVKREYCLERRRGQLRALTTMLSREPDKALAFKAVQLVQALPPLEYCADPRALMTAVPPPEDPAVRTQVDGLREQVDQLELLLGAGKYTQGLSLGEELMRRVERLEHAPLRAQVLYLMASLKEGAGDYQGAEEQARRALVQAAQGREFTLLARTWSLLALVVGERQGRGREAEQLEPTVEVAVELAGDDRARADWLNSQGNVLQQTGRYEEARRKLELALALRRKVLGPRHQDVAYSLDNLGNVLMIQGRYEDSLRAHEQALALRVQLLGPGHPEVAYSYNNMGNTLLNQGDAEQARENYGHAMTLLEKTLEPGHPYLAALLDNQGNALSRLGRLDEAREKHELAQQLLRKALGAEHPRVAYSLDGLGKMYLDLGHEEKARPVLERALDLRRKVLGAEHPDVAESLNHLGQALLGLGRPTEARALHEQALALQEKLLTPGSPDLTESLLGLGQVSMALGRYEEAHGWFTRALGWVAPQAPRHQSVVRALLGLGQLTLASGAPPAEAIPPLEQALSLADSELRAEVQFSLARALWSAKRDRPHALRLAAQAREYWMHLGHQSWLRRVDQWLAATKQVPGARKDAISRSTPPPRENAVSHHR